MLLPKLKLWGLTHTWVLKGTLYHGHGGWPVARDSHSPCFPFLSAFLPGSTCFSLTLGRFCDLEVPHHCSCRMGDRVSRMDSLFCLLSSCKILGKSPSLFLLSWKIDRVIANLQAEASTRY